MKNTYSGFNVFSPLLLQILHSDRVKWNLMTVSKRNVNYGRWLHWWNFALIFECSRFLSSWRHQTDYLMSTTTLQPWCQRDSLKIAWHFPLRDKATTRVFHNEMQFNFARKGAGETFVIPRNLHKIERMSLEFASHFNHPVGLQSFGKKYRWFGNWYNPLSFDFGTSVILHGNPRHNQGKRNAKRRPLEFSIKFTLSNFGST